MRDIRIQKFWTLSNMDRITAYLYSREGSYINTKTIERVCNVSTRDVSSYLKWLIFKGVAKRQKIKLQTSVHYVYTFNKLPPKKEYIKDLVVGRKR